MVRPMFKELYGAFTALGFCTRLECAEVTPFPGFWILPA